MEKTTNYGRLFILEGSIPTIGMNKKEANEYDRWRMEGS